MKSFDEFFSENFEYGLSSPAKNIIKFTYEAGQQSKQAEVDELRKRIDRAVEHIEDYYGVVELSMIVDILKGDQL